MSLASRIGDTIIDLFNDLKEDDEDKDETNYEVVTPIARIFDPRKCERKEKVSGFRKCTGIRGNVPVYGGKQPATRSAE